MGTLCLMLPGLLTTQFTTLILVLPGLMLFATFFLPPIRLPVAGSASVPEERRLYFICSFTIWGSSVAGTLGDTFWAGSGWSGVSAFIAVMLAAALLLANQLRKIPVLVKKVR